MPDDRPAPEGGPLPGDDTRGPGAPQGLSWSWELDFGALLSALNSPAPWNRAAPASAAPASAAAGGAAAGGDLLDGAEGAAADLDAILDAMQAAESRELPAGEVAGRIAECLPAGPDLAGWLATVTAGGLEDGALAGVAASWRRLASWAQAGELAAVAQIASRSAARDDKIGVDPDGRPARIPAEAAAQLSLALVMSQCNASWWMDLGVTLAWRLAATGEALAAGTIDLPRARLIAEATGLLDDDAARAVQDRILPGAGELTSAGLRAALRRAVIAADPGGAERRRNEAETRAKVTLYSDEEGTATLAGYSLPGIRAAAAMARINALARAWKASGAGGGIDLLRAQVFIGLLSGTLPLIPPAQDAPPDDPPPDDPPPDGPPGRHRPGGPRPGGTAAPPRPAHGQARTGRPGSNDKSKSNGPGPGQDAGPAAGPGQPVGPGGAGDHRDGAIAPHPASPWEGMPDPADRDAPGDWDPRDGPAGDDPATAAPGHGEEFWRAAGPAPVPEWPALPALLPAAATAPGSARPPAGGSLDLTMPWATMAGLSREAGRLGRLGPITPFQACQLAGLASQDPSAEWRVILTSPAGQALAVTRIPRPATRARPRPARNAPAAAPDQPGTWTGLVSRVTLTIPEDHLTRPPARQATQPHDILTRALRAAGNAAARATAQVTADRAAGGCAHTTATPAYRPPPRLKELIAARDLTCRFPTCRQPAWRGDLDHTRPYHDGGLTCNCNLGGLCRLHHILKQHPHWQLTQPQPGIFQWITPAGRAYLSTPGIHPI